MTKSEELAVRRIVREEIRTVLEMLATEASLNATEFIRETEIDAVHRKLEDSNGE